MGSRQNTQKAENALINEVMEELGRQIGALQLPAVEKVSNEQLGDPFQILIATMLSAQTRDAVTHAASVRLFDAAPTPATMLRLPTDEIERLIFPVSFYRAKARNIHETCRHLLSRFSGRVPSQMDDLLKLPGVGRKTANLVLILAHGSSENICVDTHVHRISNRLGWVTTRTPEETERRLYRRLPREWWPLVNLYLVTWGQNVCRPLYPLCGECVLSGLCSKVGVVRVGKGRAQ